MDRRHRKQISVRFAPETFELIAEAEKETGKTRTQVIEACIVAELAPKKKARAK